MHIKCHRQIFWFFLIQYFEHNIQETIYRIRMKSFRICQSPCTLYSEDLVTFGESDYDQTDSQGFINLWGLPDKVQALREQGKL